MNTAAPAVSLSRMFLALLRRDLLLAFRRRNRLLFPSFSSRWWSACSRWASAPTRAAGPDCAEVIWIAALLATVISLDGLFRSDFEDGTLEQYVISGHPLPLIALAKTTTHWLVAGLPLVLMSPLLAVWMNLPAKSMSVMVISLAVATPILSLIGAIGVGLTVSLKRGGQLLSLLVFPLYVPVLIMATAGIMAAADGLPYGAFLGLLLAGLITSVTLAPFAAAAALKISLS
jgi:heme exporter protein B